MPEQADLSAVVAHVEAALAQRQYADALSLADAALKRAPDHARLWALKGAAEQASLDSLAAIASYERAIGLDDRDHAAALALAELYAAANAIDSAEALLTWLLAETDDAFIRAAAETLQQRLTERRP
jgi:tetratricopeptide (TPR) repeat protein